MLFPDSTLQLPNPPVVHAHLLGTVDFDRCLAFQQRLVFETNVRDMQRTTLLLCEHSHVLSVGRSGSHAHFANSRKELISRQVAVRWVARGGGCLLHSPGQLAVYIICPLDLNGLSVGEFCRRLQTGTLSAFCEIGFRGATRPGRHGIWGRSGQLVHLGVAVKNGISHHGLFINVAPAMHLARLVDSDPFDHSPIGSLMAERQQPIRMTQVREALVRHLASALGNDRPHLVSGHPLWQFTQERHAKPVARCG